MDFAAILSEHFVLVVALACLIVGYVVKHATFLKWVPNNDIPWILAVFGGILNIFVSGLSIESVVYGAFMGLASTGLHQVFKEFIERGSTTKTDTK
jgi:predicted ABC-type exoprotein transport system permease subunit